MLRRVVALAAVLLATGCTSALRDLPPRDNTLAWDEIGSTCGPSSGGTGIRALRLRTHLLGIGPMHRPLRAVRRARIFPNPSREKIYPTLSARIRRASPAALATAETLLVTFRETLTIPPFPSLDENAPRTSPSNLTKLLTTDSLVSGIRSARDSSYAADSTDLVSLGGQVLHRHWLTHSLLVTLPLGAVADLATRPHVVYIQPRVGIEAPPSCPPSSAPPDNGYAGDDPIEARTLIQSDAFRNLGLSYGYLSLLDTGVWTGHPLLSGVSLGIAGDCVNGGLDCLTTSGTPLSTTDQCTAGEGHGTASAALLAGGTALGDRWRGAIDATVDYLQVYAPGNCGDCDLCLDADAVTHAFETALDNGDRVIVAEVVSETPDRAAVGMSANNAFSAGAVVIAANGNTGPTAASTESPASAPLALGIGARDLLALDVTDASQSRGPAAGGRIKPDLQAPTGAETARLMESGCARTDLLHSHLATSGATPFAGAAATLLRNWMKLDADPVMPGNVYAGMILAGRHYGENLNNTEGAGMLELPTDGCAWWGWGFVGMGQDWVVPLDVDATSLDSLEAAIWWPEQPAVTTEGDGATRHSDIQLYLEYPSGTALAQSTQGGSVFERATVELAGRSGKWRLVISADSMYDPTTLQVVYWVAALRKKR